MIALLQPQEVFAARSSIISSTHPFLAAEAVAEAAKRAKSTGRMVICCETKLKNPTILETDRQCVLLRLEGCPSVERDALENCLEKHELEEEKAEPKRKEPKIDGCLI